MHKRLYITNCKLQFRYRPIDLFHVVKYVKPFTSGMEAPLRREDKQSWKSFIIYNLNYVMYFPAKTGLDSQMMSKCVTEYRFGS